MHHCPHRGTVDLLAMHRLRPEAYPFLLQSAAAHPQAGRYDILFAFPEQALEARAPSASDFFAELNRAAAAETAPTLQPLPFCGGWFLLLGYEAARYVEPGLHLPASPYRLPDALAVRCRGAVIVDRTNNVTHFIAERGEAELAQLRRDSEAAAPAALDQPRLLRVDEDADGPFLDGVQRILDYLRAGDVFQVNLSRAWQAQYERAVDAASLYERLRRTNPAPFAGLARWQGSTVLSSSPERLIEIDGGVAQTRPIAGTQARKGEGEDLPQREKLIGSLKERAEHVMLIDLERNDLGRVCVPGSVEVSELMSIESYAHVHHIVSNVRGRLRAGTGPGEALRAVFPGGTITGAPKVRAMEIIAELEGVGRGPYTGAMGYLSRCGRLDTNILIRTLVVEGDRVSFRAGAGIVADSQPRLELAETRAKARGLLLALGAAT
ncbi:MAG: aminodeoxychorismate synthase component I [Nevskia sp.]